MQHRWIQCFETRTGPAGRPGTRLTRAWDRSGSKQKPVWELARWNPVDPAGRPGQTRLRPDLLFYIYTKTSNDEDERCIIVAIANRDKTSLGTNNCNREELRSRRLLITVSNLRIKLDSCFSSRIFFFHSLFSLFFAFFLTCSSWSGINLQFLISATIHSQFTPTGMFLCSFLDLCLIFLDSTSTFFSWSLFFE
jgi:hypothetical protein